MPTSGLGAMVDDVVGLLERTAGVPRSSLHYEVYGSSGGETTVSAMRAP
jgi:hypothetical protein